MIKPCGARSWFVALVRFIRPVAMTCQWADFGQLCRPFRGGRATPFRVAVKPRLWMLAACGRHSWYGLFAVTRTAFCGDFVEIIMDKIERAKLAALVRQNSGNLPAFFSRVAGLNEYARNKLVKAQCRKPFYAMTTTEHEDLLGFMLGFNIIEG